MMIKKITTNKNIIALVFPLTVLGSMVFLYFQANSLKTNFVWLFQKCLEISQTIFASEYLWANIVQFLFFVALLVGFVRGVWFLIKQFYFYFKFVKDIDKIAVDTKIDDSSVKIIDDSRRFAFTAGFLNPNIYISKGMTKMLDKEELRAVVLHEKYHQKRLHSIYALFFNFLSKFLFFVPIVPEIASYIAIKQEIDADRYTISKVGRKPLSSSLLKISLSDIDYSFNMNMFSDIAPRVEYILNKKEHKLHVSLRLVLLSLVVVLFMGIFSGKTKANHIDMTRDYTNSYACENSLDIYSGFGFEESVENMSYFAK